MKRIMGVMLSLLLVASMLGNDMIGINVKAKAAIAYDKVSIYNGNGYSIKYEIESQWEDEYIANVTITNTGDKTIENWELSFMSREEYSNIWNAKVTYHSAKNYNVKNAGHNQNIQPGQSVSFGFQAKFTDYIDVPKSYNLIGDTMEVNKNEYQVSYKINSQWNTGCTLDVSIYNNSSDSIEDWAIDFDLEDEIVDI